MASVGVGYGSGARATHTGWGSGRDRKKAGIERVSLLGVCLVYLRLVVRINKA